MALSRLRFAVIREILGSASALTVAWLPIPAQKEARLSPNVNSGVLTVGDRITGGSVTAGIDFALTIAGILCGKDRGKLIK